MRMESCTIDHKAAFLGGEGDAYFLRNRGSSHDREFLYDFYRPHARGRVLEIGCSDGASLSAITVGKAQGYGIDPSEQAILAGWETHPHLHLSRGTADALWWPNGFFDMVIFGFCLCWIDRHLLAAVVTEADRVLKDGGLLGIADFDPPEPIERRNHHFEGGMTFKMDHSVLFLSNQAYKFIDKIVFSQEGPGLHPDPNERFGAWLLRKRSAT